MFEDCQQAMSMTVTALKVGPENISRSIKLWETSSLAQSRRKQLTDHKAECGGSKLSAAKLFNQPTGCILATETAGSGLENLI